MATMVALLASAAIVLGQVELAAVTGTVTDDKGHPIEGVTIRLRDLSRGAETILKSDRNGRFYRRGLRAVEYEIVVEKPGYQPVQDRVKLGVGVDRRLDFRLAVAAPEGASEFMAGVEAFNRGDNQAAAAAFEEALKKAPDAPEVRINLALAYLRLSRVDDAIAELEQAAALAPGQPRALFQLGSAYVEARRYDKAIEAFEKGLTIMSDLSDPIAYEATVTLGATYFATGRVDRAAARFEQALNAKPDAPAPKLGLGKCASSQGNVEKALKYFNEVVTRAPGTPEAAEAEAFIKELKKVKGPDEEEPSGTGEPG